ncbi:MAG: amidohydrolase family protein [Planctomycetes bacterium]|jgi:predicted TIM-barrel fold metal-dependent hydrolase|nr:amidohydrolase family protein [Planctomycetota bacterium]
MFIDIHVHTRYADMMPTRPNGTMPYTTPEQLIERYDAIGVEKAVLLPGIGPECAIVPQSNEEIVRIARQYEGRFIPFCNIDPRSMTNSSDAPLGHLLEHYKKLGCKGLGEVCTNLPISDPRVQNLFKCCQDTDMPLTFHLAAQIGGIYGLYDEPGLPQLELALQKFPKLKFFGHSQTFWAEMGVLETPADRYGYPQNPIDVEGVVPKFFRRYSNLYGDLSAGSGCNAIKRDRKYGVKFLNEFQDRLFFGTDICAPTTPTPLVDYLLELKNAGEISQTVFDKIARGNAIRILGL